MKFQVNRSIVKSVNIKFTEQEIQFDSGFTPLSCEITKIEKHPIGGKICQH